MMMIDRELLQTGITAIDKQHDEYADLVNRVFDEAEKGHNSRQTLDLEIRAILDYAIEHFDAEELLMQTENYPDYEEHRAKHDIFREQTDSLTLNPEDEVGVDIDDYMKLLNNWLVTWFTEQVQQDDIMLAQYLRERS